MKCRSIRMGKQLGNSVLENKHVWDVYKNSLNAAEWSLVATAGVPLRWRIVSIDGLVAV
jgi:hypothetical protein